MIQQLQTGGPEAATVLREVEALRARRSQLTSEIAATGGTDAGYVAGVQQAAAVAKEGANRWTDNIFVCRSYAENKLNTDRTQFHDVRYRLDPGADLRTTTVVAPFMPSICCCARRGLRA